MLISALIILFISSSSCKGYDDFDTTAFVNAEPIHPVINPDALAAEFAELGENDTARSDLGCKHTLKLDYGDAGSIMSPNYPKPYPSNADCSWTLESPQASKISVTFFDVHTQPWLFAFFDYVLVSRTGDFEDAERLVGDMNRMTPWTMISSSNKFGIQFRSSSYLNYRGFKLIYMVQHTLKDTETSHVILQDTICGKSPCTQGDDIEPETTPTATLAAQTYEVDADRREHNGKYSENDQVIYPKVVGGEVTIPHAYPWMVAMLIDRSSFCGGTLIDNKHILTAAHCTDNATSITVLLGSHNLRSTKAKEPSRIIMNITMGDIFQHPHFNKRTVSHDIAIIRLPRAVNFTDEVRPVCLPNRHYTTETFENRTVRVTGWGKTLDTPGAVSPQLKHVEISVLSNSLCKQRYRSIVTGNLICGKTEPKNSPCKGDSGGPLHIVEKFADGERMMQIGLVSFGASTCETGEPVGFTRVTAFMDFIHRVTNS